MNKYVRFSLFLAVLTHSALASAADDVIRRYALAQRICYEVSPGRTSIDRRRACFSGRDSAGDMVVMNYRYWWRIGAESTHEEERILWDNEHADGWDWELLSRTPSLRVAVRMLVPRLPSADDPLGDEPVLRILLRCRLRSEVMRRDSVIALDSFSVQWSAFRTTSDTVIFFDHAATLPAALLAGSDSSGTHGIAIDVEVRSRGIVKSYLNAIYVSTPDAEALLGGVDMDPRNADKAAASAAVRREIRHAVAAAQADGARNPLPLVLDRAATFSEQTPLGYLRDPVFAGGVIEEIERK